MTATNEAKIGVAIEKAIREIPPEGRETVFDLVEDANGNQTITIRHDHAPPAPHVPPKPLHEVEKKNRKHTLHTAKALCDWLVTRADRANTTVYVDAPEARVVAALGEDTTGGVETVVFAPQRDPAFAPWERRKALPLVDAVRFLRANQARIIEPTNADEMLRLLSQIRTTTNVRADVGVGRDSVNGIVVERKVGTGVSHEPLSLPEEIVVRVPVYLGRAPIDLEVMLEVNPGDKDGVTITIMFTPIDVDQQIVAAFDSFADEIRATLRDWLVVDGAPAWVAKEYRG